MNQPIQTGYRGGVTSFEEIKRQIAERWSSAEAERYDPKTNCMSYRRWREAGYFVLPNQKALSTTVILERRNEQGVISKYPKRISLFYHLQVSPLGVNS